MVAAVVCLLYLDGVEVVRGLSEEGWGIYMSIPEGDALVVVVGMLLLPPLLLLVLLLAVRFPSPAAAPSRSCDVCVWYVCDVFAYGLKGAV